MKRSGMIYFVPNDEKLSDDGETFFFSGQEPLVYQWCEEDRVWKAYAYRPVMLGNADFSIRLRFHSIRHAKAWVDVRNLCSGIKSKDSWL